MMEVLVSPSLRRPKWRALHLLSANEEPKWEMELLTVNAESSKMLMVLGV